MILHSRLRGRPLHILLLVLGCWIGLRFFTWTPPQWRESPAEAFEWPLITLFAGNAGRAVAEPVAGFDRGPVSFAMAPESAPRTEEAGFVPRFQTIQVPVYYQAGAFPVTGYAPALAEGAPMMSPAVWFAGDGRPALQMAAFGQGSRGMPATTTTTTMPGQFEQAGLTGQSIPDAAAPVPLSPGLAERKGDRWSADAWMLARKEAPLSPGTERSVYGGSQAGAVLRYHIAPTSGYRPLAYVRVSSATGAVRESEIALGLGVRPIPSLPITLAAEARGFRGADGRKSFRPAVLAYTELPPLSLPLGLVGETYVQAGYVHGRYKSAFVDGQLRVDRKIAQVGGSSLRLGGGIWGGMQKGASRLDAGPGASALVDIWGTPSRVSLDWRFRLLGDAEPKSGPALTISAGF